MHNVEHQKQLFNIIKLQTAFYYTVIFKRATSTILFVEKTFSNVSGSDRGT